MCFSIRVTTSAEVLLHIGTNAHTNGEDCKVQIPQKRIGSALSSLLWSHSQVSSFMQEASSNPDVFLRIWSEGPLELVPLSILANNKEEGEEASHFIYLFI